MIHVSAKSHSLVQREVYLPQLDVMAVEGKLNNCLLVPTNSRKMALNKLRAFHFTITILSQYFFHRSV